MTKNPVDDSMAQSQPKAVRLLWILVAVTAVLSLLYAIQYYLGGPLRLPVVGEVYSVDVAPDGGQIAIGAADGRVRLWDVPEQIRGAVDRDFEAAEEVAWPVYDLSGLSDAVLEVGFAPDGAALIAVTRDGTVAAWELGGKTVTQEFNLGLGPLVDVDLDDSRQVLAALGEDGVVHVWDVAAEREIQSVSAGANAREAVVLNADGSLVAASDGTGAQVWDVQTGALLHTLAAYCEEGPSTTMQACEDADENWLGHAKDVASLAFSPDDELLATGSADTTIIFWELATGEVKWSSVGHWATVTAMVFDDAGEFLLTGGADYKSRTIRVVGGKSTGIYEGHLATVNDLAFGPQEGKIVTVGDDGSLRVWETANQYLVHLEWAQRGLQPGWGRLFSAWMLVSGILGLVALFGLRRIDLWSHLLVLGLFLIGPIVVLGLPLLEVMNSSWFVFALLGIVAIWAGLKLREQIGWWSLAFFLLGFVLLLVRPVLDYLANPRSTAIALNLVWPLLILGVWYVILLVVTMRDEVAELYQAPKSASLSQQIMVSQRTVKTRFGLFSLAVWITLLVVLYSILRQFNLDIAFMGSFLEFIMLGSGITFYVSALSIILAVFLALLGALGRLSKNPIANSGSGFYISLIRGTPLLVQIYIWYLGLPRLGLVLDPRVAGILALGVNYGAYMTEIFRAGIQAINIGQREAAQALGMSGFQTFRRIILPQAFRIVIPPIGNQFIAMMKDSSLVSIMAVQELTWRANKIGRQYFRGMETFIIAAAFYWILTVIFQLFQGKLEEYMARGERR